jgi:hypothetical protein
LKEHIGEVNHHATIRVAHIDTALAQLFNEPGVFSDCLLVLFDLPLPSCYLLILSVNLRTYHPPCKRACSGAYCHTHACVTTLVSDDSSEAST